MTWNSQQERSQSWKKINHPHSCIFLALYLVVLWKTWLNDLSFCPLSEKTRNLLSMSMKQPTMSPACHWGTESWDSQSALNHMSCLQPSYAWLQSSSPIPYLQSHLVTTCHMNYFTEVSSPFMVEELWVLGGPAYLHDPAGDQQHLVIPGPGADRVGAPD